MEGFYNKCGKLELVAVRRFNGQSLLCNILLEAVLLIWLSEVSNKLKLLEAEILLSEFGEAFSNIKQQNFEFYTVLVSWPPETCFELFKSLY